MNKERKTNIIKALKEEIHFYKNQPVKIVREPIPLNHLRLNSSFAPHEVAMMPKDIIPELLIRRISEAFTNSIPSLPINTFFDEECGCYRAELDLWVKFESRSGRRY